jgi:hypothetical protein
MKQFPSSSQILENRLETMEAIQMLLDLNLNSSTWILNHGTKLKFIEMILCLIEIQLNSLDVVGSKPKFINLNPKSWNQIEIHRSNPLFNEIQWNYLQLDLKCWK